MDSPVRVGGRRSVDGFLTASWATSWFAPSVEDNNTEDISVVEISWPWNKFFKDFNTSFEYFKSQLQILLKFCLPELPNKDSLVSKTQGLLFLSVCSR